MCVHFCKCTHNSPHVLGQSLARIEAVKFSNSIGQIRVAVQPCLAGLGCWDWHVRYIYLYAYIYILVLIGRCLCVYMGVHLSSVRTILHSPQVLGQSLTQTQNI